MVSEGSSSDDSQDGWLVSEDGEPAESEEASHQSGDSGSPGMMFNEPGNKTVADSVEEDQLNQDKGDDNMGMEDEDIANELERNLEQVSDTYMIDLEPLPSGPSNEKVKQALKAKKRNEKIPTVASDENQLEAPNPKK
ncbi:hypothetical protein Q3G72_016767 [Acer saccharum]|nr:hypothetical protein Q3G72_016767 [Acer saccharum]